MDKSFSDKVIRFVKLGRTFVQKIVQSICNIFLIRDVFVLLFIKYAGYVGVLNCLVITLFNIFQVPLILFLCFSNNVLQYDFSENISINYSNVLPLKLAIKMFFVCLKRAIIFMSPVQQTVGTRRNQ